MGWVYFIQNEDLYKIGITENLERRMRELQPCTLLKALSIENPRRLERVLHRKYRSVRIPQTEYFRLSKAHVEEVIAVLEGSPRYTPIQAAQQRRPPSVHSSDRFSRFGTIPTQQVEQSRPPRIPRSERFSRFESNQQQYKNQSQDAPIYNLNNPPPHDYLNIQGTPTYKPFQIKKFLIEALPQILNKFFVKHKKLLISVTSFSVIIVVRIFIMQ